MHCWSTINKYFIISYSHSYSHSIDADGLRNFVLNCSKYNLVNQIKQSKEQYFILPNQSFDDIPKDIQQLYIYHTNTEDMTTLNISNYSFHQLKSITIGNGCFKDVREFVIDGLESLESVIIGELSIRKSSRRRDDGICRITNCPNLRQLEIGDCSFKDFKSFELSNLNSIQSIEFGHWCFRYAEGFSLKGEWKEWMNEWNVIWMKMKMMF